MTEEVAFPIGLKIKDVRMMTKEELNNEGWEENWGSFPVVIILEDGSKIYASQDPEGNGPGALFGMTAYNTPVIITPLTDGMISESEIKND